MSVSKKIKTALKINLRKFSELLLQLTAVLLLLTLTRLIFYAFNTEYYPEMSWARFGNILHGGLLFDVSALMFVNALYILLFLLPFPFTHKKIYRTVLKYLFIITNAVALSANMADVFYFDFTLKRSTFDVFMFAGETNILQLLPEFLTDFWYGFLIGIILITILIFVYNKIPYCKSTVPHLPAYIISGTLIFVLSGYLSVIGMRGSFVNKTFPITIGDAGKYTDKPLDMALVLNTPFSIIKTAEKLSLQEKHYFSEDELKNIYTTQRNFESDNDFRSLNVVIIIMESFSREYLSFFNPELPAEESYTPFLDSLAEHSLCFPRAFANGRQSVSALPAICAGIPYAKQTFVSSPYASNEFTGLGQILSEKNYHTSFFHGANNGSLGLDAFMKRAGYKHYFGKDEYGNNADYDGSWGIRDEAFFRFFADKLNRFPKPFHSVIFSLSSHHPYSLPEHYADSFPNLQSPKLRAYRYSDNALRMFFNLASQSDWYDNTLFVITADHGAQSKNPRYANPVGAYAVPIIFFSPSALDLKGTDSTVVQHLDIMPSVLAYLNYEKPFFAFGKNMFNSRHTFGAFINSNEIWQHIRDDCVIQMQNDSLIGRFNYENDFKLEKQIQSNDTLSVAEKQLKAFIQTHNYRMIHNELQLKKE